MSENRTPGSTAIRLLGHERRERIVDEVRRLGAVRVRELTAQFGVSDMTIRRDIDSLDAANRLQKVHGGATFLTNNEEPGFHAKSSRQLTEKERIGRAAVARVEPGSAIGITGGTTTYQMVEHLTMVSNLTVVTNSLPMAAALHAVRRSDLTLLLTGGSPTPSDAMVGPVASRSLENLHLDHVFMGVHGMGPSTGFTTPNLPERQTNQAFINATNSLIVLADATKWGTTALCSIAPLNSAQVLITDDDISAEARQVLVDEVGELVLV